MNNTYNEATALLEAAGFDAWGYPIEADEANEAPSILDNRNDRHGLGDDIEAVARVLGDYDLVAAWLESERIPSTSELMSADLNERGGERAHIESADGTKVRYTNANEYERKAVAYGRNPRSVTVVDGTMEWLGTYVDEQGKRHEPSDGRKGKAGRKASCDCGACNSCSERRRKAEYRARVAEQEQARLKEQALTKVEDRLASRSW